MLSLNTRGTYCSHKWVDESGADAGTHIPDGKNEARRGTFPCGVVGEGEMCLSHTHRQVIEAL